MRRVHRTSWPTPLIRLLAVGLLLVAGCAPSASREDASAPEPATVLAEAGPAAHVYRSATCECCEGHAQHLERAGYEVVEHVVEDVAAVKSAAGVPDSLHSCHTTLVAGYAVEGHVPAEVIAQTVDGQAAVDGIALAGMPSGAPGMPGELEGPLEVRTFVDGQDAGAAR